MNQPASKEPSMDEILSSIRQIIADDDPADSAVPNKQQAAPAPEPVSPDEAAVSEDLSAELSAQPSPTAADQMVAEIPEAPIEDAAVSDMDAPLALSVDQMLEPANPALGPEALVAEPVPGEATETESFAAAPSDNSEVDEVLPEPVVGQVSETPLETVESDATDLEESLMRAAPDPTEFSEEFDTNLSDDVEMVVPDDIAFVGDDEDDISGVETSLDDAVEQVDLADLDAAAEVDAQPEPTAVESALPDPTLTEDMTEQLLEPTTQAAASSAFSQLDALALSSDGRTVEDLIRELLRPMLKGWLDENLPGVVEKLVQREIERVSRGKRQ